MEESKKKLGQAPAFPKDSFQNQYQIGMSKRFYAACMAMQGLLANGTENVYEKDLTIMRSFEYADEILRQEEL